MKNSYLTGYFPRTGWIIIVLSLTNGGWMLFDGLHALFTGLYVTPASGPLCGAIGPVGEPDGNGRL